MLQAGRYHRWHDPGWPVPCGMFRLTGNRMSCDKLAGSRWQVLVLLIYSPNPTNQVPYTVHMHTCTSSQPSLLPLLVQLPLFVSGSLCVHALLSQYAIALQTADS